MLAVPPDSRIEAEPYSGPHPRLTSRPAEWFDFPIRVGETGPVESLFSGPLQYPFFCGRDRTREDLAQPLIDNQDGIGVPVFASRDGEHDVRNVLGYSRDCSHPTRVSYYYLPEGGNDFLPLSEADNDIARIRVNGRETEFVVRLETGTINRFFYAIAALRGPDETAEAMPDPGHWNQRLIYQFRGGVGIGRQQGDFSPRHVLRERSAELAEGYAVVYSTGNQTRNHFNMQLAEDTAWRVKRQFVSLYGEPLYTVGVGGSGGAIQQYLFAQNAPGLLDGIIPLYGYPDVITQTIHIQDCELLEYFMDVTDADNPLWRDWEQRSLLQGLNAHNQARNRFAPAEFAAHLLTGQWSRLRSLRGASECISGWRGLTPLMSNPHFVDNEPAYHASVLQQTRWSHWDDLVTIYGVDEHGHARRSWDNVGVQYGLAALRQGSISMETFLRLNATIGGWQPAHAMQEEKFWFLNRGFWPIELSLYSTQNMTHGGRAPDGTNSVAARTEGDLAAMQAAYLSGQVFVGVIDVPIIDARHYLDDELDMHHALASFTTRTRIKRAMGNAEHQLIWVSRQPHDPQREAFAVMDEWLLKRRQRPGASAAETRPRNATHRCHNAAGELLAAGNDVWQGDWNGAAETGACLQHYPIYRTSRQVAGEGMAADIFLCALQSVDEAIEQGVYGSVDVTPYRDRLQQIFEQGVCDYSQPDAALPPNLLQQLRHE